MQKMWYRIDWKRNEHGRHILYEYNGRIIVEDQANATLFRFFGFEEDEDDDDPFVSALLSVLEGCLASLSASLPFFRL